jgi:hypothetical protein
MTRNSTAELLREIVVIKVKIAVDTKSVSAPRAPNSKRVRTKQKADTGIKEPTYTKERLMSVKVNHEVHMVYL